LIYPEWWGFDDSNIIDPTNNEAPISNRRKATDENSLDRRLLEAKEAAAKLERMFAENINTKRTDSKRRAHF
jgi:hypothetical protein